MVCKMSIYHNQSTTQAVSMSSTDILAKNPPLVSKIGNSQTSGGGVIYTFPKSHLNFIDLRSKCIITSGGGICKDIS